MATFVSDTFATLTGGDTSGAKASKQAGRLQSQAFQSASGILKPAISEAQAGLQPFIGAGTDALATQTALLGGGTPEQQQQAIESFRNLPGQQFAQQQAEKATLRNAAATGGLGGGRVQLELQKQAQGRADQNLNNFLGQLNQLSARGQQAASEKGRIGVGGASQLGGLLTQGAGAQAAGLLGAQQANQQFTGQLINLGGQIAGAASDRDIKDNIEDMSPEDCFNVVKNIDIKSWRYKGEKETHFGPMYQDAPQCIKFKDKKVLNVHNEVMLLMGAIQHLENKGVFDGLS